jgi:hypothetical protein
MMEVSIAVFVCLAIISKARWDFELVFNLPLRLGLDDSDEMFSERISAVPFDGLIFASKPTSSRSGETGENACTSWVVITFRSIAQ